MNIALVSAAGRPGLTPRQQAASRVPLAKRAAVQGGALPASLSRLLSTDAEATSLVIAAFQSSV
ncbi:hypothetical protein ACWD8L_19845 [Streptomyces sp. NPDC005133]|uniref:hypothetical protein n=1 Tax=unclassified Streptomyces TaxID=2593676 RepID=UPI0028C4FCDF|nr:hypothetical protein [Streptomyces sp. AM2-3-1]WNO63594.1 hypothetical protein RPQ02_07180 [Streptomyces sp. AM2-3-1]WTE58557.1 hypothetical protein OG784_07155 [Streptomyces sp. NBC_01617]